MYLSIDSISTAVCNHSSTLSKRICSVDSPTQHLCFYMLSDYILDTNLVPGSTVSRIGNLGLSPVNVIFNKVTQIHDNCYNDGIVDSLRSMIFSENFIKPWCNEHILVQIANESFLISPYVFMMFNDLFYYVYYVCILFSPLVEV